MRVLCFCSVCQKKSLRKYMTLDLTTLIVELELSIYGNEMGVLPLRRGVKETMDLP